MRALLLLAALLLAAPAAAADAPPPPLPLKAGVFDPPRRAPDFTLQGSDGKPLTLSSHRGRIVLLGFGFTSCPDVCPVTLATLAAARRQLGDAGREVQVVYVTVDPERDTPARMAGYLEGFHPEFLGATGTPEQLATVRREFGVAAQKKDLPRGGYLYGHSSFVYLIDREGWLRALMPYGRGAADFAHDLKLLLAEGR